jgi:hypothetical protein
VRLFFQKKLIKKSDMFNKKAILFAAALFSASLSMFAQDDDTGFSFGFNGGYDYNMNAYKMEPEQSTGLMYYNKPDQWNIGADFGVNVTKKFRPRIELKYVHTSFGTKNSPTSNQPYLRRTITQVHYFDMNLRLDYKIIDAGKFTAYLSPAIKWEIQTGVKSKTYKEGYHSTISRFTTETAYPTYLGAGALAIQMKYKVTDYLGITFSPEYTMFFRNYIRSNNKPYMRASANLGFEFAF